MGKVKLRDVVTGNVYEFRNIVSSSIFTDGFDRPYDLVEVADDE